MNIQLLAFLLLLGRLVSEFFITRVIIRQWKIRNIKTHPRIMAIKKVLFYLAIAVFIGNIYPLVLDILTLVWPGIRSTQNVNIVGVAYSLDNNLTFVIASILIWTLYKLADTVIEIAELIGVAEAKKAVKND